MSTSSKFGRRLEVGEVLTFYLREPLANAGIRGTLRGLIQRGDFYRDQIDPLTNILATTDPTKAILAHLVRKNRLTEDEAARTLRELSQQTRPLVCIAAELVESESTLEEVAFEIRFAISVFNTKYEESCDRYRGREIAWERLAARKTVTKRALKDADPPGDYHTQVGMTIPIHRANLVNVDGPRAERIVIQRAILAQVAHPSYRFPSTARKLAKRWLAEGGE